MLESFRLRWNLEILGRCWDLSRKALNANNYLLAIQNAERALNAGRKALSLSDKVNPEAKERLQKVLPVIEKYCQELREKNSAVQQSPEEKELRLAVKKQFVEMNSQMFVSGANKAGCIADKIVDMYRIAKDRLGAGKKVLRMLYIDNETVPEPLKKVISSYLDGSITKEEAEKKLDELATKTKEYLSELGVNPEAGEHPRALLQRDTTPEDKLKSTLVAEAMKDDGSIDQKRLFLNLAEIVLFDEWAALSKRIGDDRDPTFEELLEAQLSAFKRAYEKNKQLFASEKEFNDWVDQFTKALRSNSQKYTSTVLPVYRVVAEKIAKR